MKIQYQKDTRNTFSKVKDFFRNTGLVIVISYIAYCVIAQSTFLVGYRVKVFVNNINVPLSPVVEAISH